MKKINKRPKKLNFILFLVFYDGQMIDKIRLHLRFYYLLIIKFGFFIGFYYFKV